MRSLDLLQVLFFSRRNWRKTNCKYARLALRRSSD